MNQDQPEPGHAVSSRTRRHLDDVELGYLAHLRVAFGIGGAMIAAGAACLLHGLLPALFQDRASRTVSSLHRRMEQGTPAARYLETPGPLEYEI